MLVFKYGIIMYIVEGILVNKIMKIRFCHIGGYECLRDGTQTEICRSLSDVQCVLEDYEIEYDKTIKDPIKLAESIEDEWADRFDDGGGSGWIEF